MTSLRASAHTWKSQSFRAVTISVAGVLIGWAGEQADGRWKCWMKDHPDTPHMADSLEEATALLRMLVTKERGA